MTQPSSARRPARAFLGLLLALLSVLGLGAGCGGEEGSAGEPLAAPAVTHVRVTGPIDVGALALVSRAIRTARDQGSNALLVELDTPGGSLDVLWDLQKQLLAAEESGIDLACWIHDHAASAGALVALTARHVHMSSSGTVGSAYPIVVGPEGPMSLPADEGVREKELSFLRAQFASMAERRGRPAALAMAMVDPNVEVRQVRVENELVLLDRDAWDDLKESGKPYELVRTIAARGQLLNLTARQAVELRFADGIADTLAEVLARIGHAAGDAAPVLERSAGDRTVVWIERLAPLLVLMGLVLGYLELKLPGFGLAGILSAACFLTVVAGKYLVGLANAPHVVAVALGLALIVVEILVAPGTLWFGIVGAVLVAGAIVTASLGPGFSFSDPLVGERLLDTGIEYGLAAVLAIVVAVTISRWLPKTPVLRRAILAPETAGAFAGALPEAAELPAVGAAGSALTDLRPVGKVVFDARPGAEYEARSLGPFLVAGARVRVVERGAGRLVVESAAEDRT